MVDISEFKITELPFGERRTNFKPDIRIYEYLKEEGVRKMINDHYELLVKSEIKDIFPPKGELLEGAKKRSADFFVQRLGGPEYYKMTRGNPMLANRHLPFKITPKTRIEWLNCYRQVLSRIENVPDDLILSFWRWLDEFSNWMVNQHDEPQFKIGFRIPK
ncbi:MULTISPECIES: globin domain-containing protein [unclassified Saccharicrinis]|uniref:globin domain-containing protein n=1 Tax=unclassified Saccharicrinis TaxID=2646859 RepID=UPI003D34C1A2